MQALNKEEIYKLNSIYNSIDTILDPENLHHSDKYDFNCFSVFDHRLTNDEAEKLILFYQQALENGETTHSKQYYHHHDQLLEFYLDLYSQTTVYGVFGNFSKKYKNGIKFENIEEYKLHVLLNIREQHFLGIVLPEFFSIVRGNFDLVHLLYTLKDKPEGKTNISAIMEKHKLFFI